MKTLSLALSVLLLGGCQTFTHVFGNGRAPVNTSTMSKADRVSWGNRSTRAGYQAWTSQRKRFTTTTTVDYEVVTEAVDDAEPPLITEYADQNPGFSEPQQYITDHEVYSNDRPIAHYGSPDVLDTDYDDYSTITQSTQEPATEITHQGDVDEAMNEPEETPVLLAALTDDAPPSEPSVIANMVPTSIQWQIDDSLRATIERWCEEESETCLWKAPFDYQNELTAVIEADTLPEAIRKTLSLYRSYPRKLALHQYPNALVVREQK